MTGIYKFTGKPDRVFPGLVTGKHYELTIKEVSKGIFGWLVGNTRPIIVWPIQCPYRSWESFYANWEKAK